MNLKPCNRHILIRKILTEEKENKILLPDDYKTKPAFAKAKVLGLSEDCKISLLQGEQVIYLEGMEETIEIDGQKHYLLLENHVLCRIEEGE